MVSIYVGIGSMFVIIKKIGLLIGFICMLFYFELCYYNGASLFLSIGEFEHLQIV